MGQDRRLIKVLGGDGLTILHSEHPKLYRVLAVLSVIKLKRQKYTIISYCKISLGGTCPVQGGGYFLSGTA